MMEPTQVHYLWLWSVTVYISQHQPGKGRITTSSISFSVGILLHQGIFLHKSELPLYLKREGEQNQDREGGSSRNWIVIAVRRMYRESFSGKRWWYSGRMKDVDRDMKLKQGGWIRLLLDGWMCGRNCRHTHTHRCILIFWYLKMAGYTRILKGNSAITNCSALGQKTRKCQWLFVALDFKETWECSIWWSWD